MNYSSKFLGSMRYREVSVPEKACTGEYRVCLFVSIYGRLLMSGAVPRRCSPGFLKEIISLARSLFETSSKSAPRTAFQTSDGPAPIVRPGTRTPSWQRCETQKYEAIVRNRFVCPLSLLAVN
ncbi:MAG: hypothetical protein H6Q41_1515 [Deltaproteobacteria bacterium]|nr:hypothetical protein [Deltaproteobacteria bacterium]